MSATSNEVPEIGALDDGVDEISPDELVGEAVEPEHDLDVSKFEEESDE